MSADPPGAPGDAPLGRRMLVVGAGSLGSVYGGLLARAGADVQLLARESHARAIQEAGGLSIDDGATTALVPLAADWRPDRLDAADVVIVLTKTPDTAAALASIDHLRDEVQVALSLQNGVRKDEQLADWCGADRVLGAVSQVGGSLLGPGAVRRTLDGPTFLGELPSGVSPRVEALASLMESAGLDTVVTDRIASATWSKLAQAVAAMSLSVLTRRYFHEILLEPQLARAFVELVREVAAVAAAVGAELDDWPGLFPVRSMTEVDDAAAVELVRGVGAGFRDRGQTEIRISMLQSLERGAPLEIDAIQPYVADVAAELGVPAPAVTQCALVVRGLAALQTTSPQGAVR